LQPDRLYRVVGFEGEDFGAQRGSDLMQTGICFDTLPQEGSALLRLI
jgi:hypothetical protein